MVSTMEIVKNVVLALHIIGVVALLGGVIFQSSALRERTARILPAMMHGAWTMLVTGVALVGLRYAIGADVDNAKITVKLVILIAIVVLALVNRKREVVANWVLMTIGALTIANVVIATVWR